MTDSLFESEREDEVLQSNTTDELLPNPGFASSLFDEPSEDATPREGAGISEETLFPADPIFFSGDAPEADGTPSEVPETASAIDTDVESIEPIESIESIESDPLTVADSGSLFDPIEPAERVPSMTVEHDPADSDGLFHVPESEAGEPITTAAFYAASALPDPIEERGDGETAPVDAPAEERERAKKPRTRQRKQRPVRELTEKELLLRRREAEQRIVGARIRFCLAALLSILLAVVEIFPLFGLHVTMPLGISRIPGSEALLDLQLLLLIALCAYRSVAQGIRSLFDGHLRYEGILCILLLFAVVYDVTLYAIGARSLQLASLVLAVSLCATVWVEISESRAAAGILSLISDPSGVSAALPSEGQARLRVARLAHADGFDEHVGDHEENSHLRFLLLLGVLLVGTLGLIFALVLEAECRPIGAALAAAFLALPSGALLSRRFYLSAMQESLLLRNTALIGESAAYSAASHGVFSIADTEAFDARDLKIKIINVFGDFRLDEAVRLVAGVYRPIGGALAEVLSGMCEEAGGPAETELTEVTPSGIVAHASGRTVVVGTRDFMTESGVRFPSDAGEESLLVGERLTILYCAVDGFVVARLYVEYTLSSGFENLADQLARLGTSIELRTADPCLSEEYLRRLSSLPRGVLSLRRVDTRELLGEKCTRAESCFFTTDRPRSLVGAWLASRRYVAARRRAEVLSVLQLALGALLLGVSVFCFGSPILPNSLAALYQLVAILASALAAKAFCRRLLADLPGADTDTEPKGTES